jgi:uridine kinase
VAVTLVGIAGGTGTGKSTIVRALLARMDGCVLGVDSYYRDLGHLTPDERARRNYDEPAAIESTLLVEHLQQLAQGCPVLKPVYSFDTHTRVGAEMVAPAPFIVVEGLFALWWSEVRELLDHKVYVDAPPDLRLARRIRRDVIERGRTVESVLEQYLSTVRPMYERYVEPTRAYADLVVTNTGTLEESLAHVLSSIRTITSEPAAEVAAARWTPHRAQEERGFAREVAGLLADPPPAPPSRSGGTEAGGGRGQPPHAGSGCPAGPEAAAL